MLAAPAVALLSVGALTVRALADRRAAAIAAVTLAAGAVVGFLPWLVGLLVLDLPYLEASIHQTSNPNEAAEVYARSVGGTLSALRDGLAHNLWPWAVSSSEGLSRSVTAAACTVRLMVSLW